MNTPPDDYDGAWKEALGEYLRECLALLFPVVHAGIDWSRPHTFLDTELQQIVRDAELGVRRADRLVQVWLLDGADTWLLIHVEVQSQEEQGFAKRMFVYYYRIFDDYDHEVVSLAVLADERPGWRPDRYAQERWESGVRYRYLVAKLTDWRDRHAELETSDNPFATVVLAHLAAQETRGDADSRERAKLHLIRRLYERGYGRERVLSLLRFVDWLLALPPEPERRVRQAIEAIEEERQMSYVTSYERMAREEGRMEAKREDLRDILRARFGVVPQALEERLAAADELTLKALIVRAATIASPDEL
jgi:hypothetical protein